MATGCGSLLWHGGGGDRPAPPRLNSRSCPLASPPRTPAHILCRRWWRQARCERSPALPARPKTLSLPTCPPHLPLDARHPCGHLGARAVCVLCRRFHQVVKPGEGGGGDGGRQGLPQASRGAFLLPACAPVPCPTASARPAAPPRAAPCLATSTANEGGPPLVPRERSAAPPPAAASRESPPPSHCVVEFAIHILEIKHIVLPDQQGGRVVHLPGQQGSRGAGGRGVAARRKTLRYAALRTGCTPLRHAVLRLGTAKKSPCGCLA